MNESTSIKPGSNMQIRFEKEHNWRARIGFVLMANDQLIEVEMFRLAPPGVGVHFARVPGSDNVTVDDLLGMEKHLADAAARLIPDSGLDVICFACTSGSALIGEERVMAELSRGAPNAQPTTLITGVIEALRALEAQRIVVGTPYLDDVNALEERYLKDQGFEVLDMQGMNLDNCTDMRRVSPEFILEYGLSLDRPEAEAIFLSCGGIRSLEVVDALEQKVGKPVIVSNQAMFWNTLRLAGINDKIEGYGQILTMH
jgi:maleate isomerase